MYLTNQNRKNLQKEIKKCNLTTESRNIINKLLDDTRLGLKLYFEEQLEYIYIFGYRKKECKNTSERSRR